MDAQAAKGELVFDEFGEVVGPSTTAAAFASMKTAERGSMRHAGGRSWVTIERTQVYGRLVRVVLEFEGGRLVGAELFFLRPDDGTSWADWSEEKELTRKAEGEAWAGEVFGKPLTLKPVEVDGKLVELDPTSWGARGPMHAVFAWGEVGSFYDSKGGSAFVVVAYGRRG